MFISRTVDGLILLPDDWVLPAGCSFAARPASVGNSYTTGTDASGYSGLWSVMEAAGVEFYPSYSNAYMYGARIWDQYSDYGAFVRLLGPDPAKVSDYWPWGGE